MRLIRLLKNDLAKEAADWVEKDIITQSQAEKICHQYQVDYHQAQNRSLAYNVLVGLGYLFVGLAVITVLGANWEDIPRAVRMWGLIALTLATQGVAIQKYRTGGASASVGMFLLGNLFYGASIILIAQIYHLGEHMPDGVFWWALGCLPIAVLLQSSMLMLQSLLLALIWFFLEASMGFYPTLFPLFILCGGLVLWRGRPSLLLFFAVILSLFFWFELTLAEIWRDGLRCEFTAEHVAVSVAMFVFAYAASRWAGLKGSVRAQDYGALLSVWCLRFGLLFLVVMSFNDPWENLLEADWAHLPGMFVVITLLSLAALALAWLSESRLSVIAFLLAFWGILIGMLLSRQESHIVVFQVVDNLLLIGTGVWLIVRGIHSSISHYFFLGVATILVTALLRYVDLIGDYVGGALLFMLFAVLLLAAARYWKRAHQHQEISS
ncbi:DUF2157 domain-containing protein [Pseudomaricurvus sp.]|uniref:DUF2157 domain-containing protein n=1 Tax=Pseudomaricurvus sp. TaxID=2004510 RepID=UPI003F6AA40A